VYDPRTMLWHNDGDDLLRPRNLPEGLTMRLWIEGRPVILPEADEDPELIAPQVLLYSSGEFNLFELELRREFGRGTRIQPNEAGDGLAITALEADT